MTAYTVLLSSTPSPERDKKAPDGLCGLLCQPAHVGEEEGAGHHRDGELQGGDEQPGQLHRRVAQEGVHRHKSGVEAEEQEQGGSQAAAQLRVSSQELGGVRGQHRVIGL